MAVSSCVESGKVRKYSILRDTGAVEDCMMERPEMVLAGGARNSEADCMKTSVSWEDMSASVRPVISYSIM